MSPRQYILELEQQMQHDIIGQQSVIRSIIITLLCEGHLLIEGLPGLAKTRAIRCLANYIESDFSRIQFTPDLLPSDITGTEIFIHDNETGKQGFEFRRGPLFGNLILVDEINRAPAKVQAALLEAMEEHQITVAGQSYPLPELFMTLATQNPIEQEGTYPLPEAQLDRFLMKVLVGYPNKESEQKMLTLLRLEQQQKHASQQTNRSQKTPLSQQIIFDCWREIDTVHCSEAMQNYIINIIDGSRYPKKLNEDLYRWIAVGASPRATIGLEKTARANAWFEGRDFVLPEDVQEMCYPVLRHRIACSYQAYAEEISTDMIIDKLLAFVILE